MPKSPPHVAVIGAGVGGLATALRLAHRGFRVTVLERHATPGGKMRQLPTEVGPVDAGPTVLTLKPVLDALFEEVGLDPEEVATFQREDMLARHFWPDGTRLDLMREPEASRENVQAAFGARAAADFVAFSARARRLYEAFEGPMMQSAAPSRAVLTRLVMANPQLIGAMDPTRSLAASLERQFRDPRLAQLFARYATYVGGLPSASPALLGLIWHAESLGVWHVAGGMHALARGMARAAQRRGAQFHYDADVIRIETQGGTACAVQTRDSRMAVDAVVFNGDPRALQTGLLGPACTGAVAPAATTPRALSAFVANFAAAPSGPAGASLAAHNVFFAKDPAREYAPLGKGQIQEDPTLYVCAQDRFATATPTGMERFEIILNAPPLEHDQPAPPSDKVKEQCQTTILTQLKQHGVTFSATPQAGTITGPQEFAEMFPGSAGSLYGRSPHGMMAAFHRPGARTNVRGLYLTGGGAHPGAGVPMAVRSARHAAEAIMHDLPLT